jgi:hypothetical protein
VCSGQSQTKRHYQDRVHLQKMVLVVVRQGRLDCMSSGRKKAIKAKGDHQAQVLSQTRLSKRLPQDSGKRWGGWFSPHISHVKGRRGGTGNRWSLGYYRRSLV